MSPGAKLLAVPTTWQPLLSHESEPTGICPADSPFAIVPLWHLAQLPAADGDRNSSGDKRAGSVIYPHRPQPGQICERSCVAGIARRRSNHMRCRLTLSISPAMAGRARRSRCITGYIGMNKGTGSYHSRHSHGHSCPGQGCQRVRMAFIASHRCSHRCRRIEPGVRCHVSRLPSPRYGKSRMHLHPSRWR